METKSKFPTEEIELPSKGLLYSPESPLSKGKVEMKYMSAREEDILTNENYIKNGTVLDKLLDSVIVTEGIDLNDLLVGDKNALLVAARILAYGKDYPIMHNGEQINVDLNELDLKYIDEDSLLEPGLNQFQFTLPHTETMVTYKILTGADDLKIKQEIKGIKKISKNASPELSTRLKYLITSVNGDDEPRTIRDFVDNVMISRDSRALREHIRNTQPDIVLTVSVTNGMGVEEDVAVPMTAGFFWPDSGI